MGEQQHKTRIGETSNPGPDVELKGVSKSYGNIEVLSPTDLSVRPGEFLTIVGPSGSGKTTILRLICGFIEPTRGTVLFRGDDITTVPTHLRPFNTVFQDYALFPHMNVESNVGYGPMLRRLPRSQIIKRVDDALQIVGLEHLKSRLPSQLSGGQKQRVALARALVCEPKVLLLDEPLSALDAAMRHNMQLFLKDLQRRVNTTFILVTHDQEEAITMSDRIAVMNSGRIEQLGSHREVYYAPQTKFVANFFGDSNLIPASPGPNGSLDTWLGRFTGINLVPAASEQSELMLSLRPETIVFLAGKPTVPNVVRLNVRITKLVFAGPLTRISAAVIDAPGNELLIKCNSAQLPENATEGSDVTVGIVTRDIAVVGTYPNRCPAITGWKSNS